METELNELSKKLNWLIDGYGITGLKISDASLITWDWIKINYNVDEA